MTAPVDALRTLARHGAELDRAREELTLRRDTELQRVRRTLSEAENGIRQTEQQQQDLVDAIDDLAETSATVGSNRPLSVPKQAEVRADLDRLKNTWPTFHLLQASERMERDERRRLAAGRTFQWIWLGLTVVGAIVLAVLPNIIAIN